LHVSEGHRAAWSSVAGPALADNGDLLLHDLYSAADPIRTWERNGDFVVATPSVGTAAVRSQSKNRHHSDSDTDSGVSEIWLDSHFEDTERIYVRNNTTHRIAMEMPDVSEEESNIFLQSTQP
jgi:hypothetical protein